jgi:hypothetical protein
MENSRFDTPEKRIARAAHIFSSFYYDRSVEILKADGISEQEIAAGFALKEAELQEWWHCRSRFGDPAYGSWPEYAVSLQPVKQLLNALRDGRAQLLSGI